jgi:hypothetical protein
MIDSPFVINFPVDLVRAGAATCTAVAFFLATQFIWKRHWTLRDFLEIGFVCPPLVFLIGVGFIITPLIAELLFHPAQLGFVYAVEFHTVSAIVKIFTLFITIGVPLGLLLSVSILHTRAGNTWFRAALSGICTFIIFDFLGITIYALLVWTSPFIIINGEDFALSVFLNCLGGSIVGLVGRLFALFVKRYTPLRTLDVKSAGEKYALAFLIFTVLSIFSYVVLARPIPSPIVSELSEVQRSVIIFQDSRIHSGASTRYGYFDYFDATGAKISPTRKPLKMHHVAEGLDMAGAHTFVRLNAVTGCSSEMEAARAIATTANASSTILTFEEASIEIEARFQSLQPYTFGSEKPRVKMFVPRSASHYLLIENDNNGIEQQTFETDNAELEIRNHPDLMFVFKVQGEILPDAPENYLGFIIHKSNEEKTRLLLSLPESFTDTCTPIPIKDHLSGTPTPHKFWHRGTYILMYIVSAAPRSIFRLDMPGAIIDGPFPGILGHPLKWIQVMNVKSNKGSIIFGNRREMIEKGDEVLVAGSLHINYEEKQFFLEGTARYTLINGHKMNDTIWRLIDVEVRALIVATFIAMLGWLARSRGQWIFVEIKKFTSS